MILEIALHILQIFERRLDLPSFESVVEWDGVPLLVIGVAFVGFGLHFGLRLHLILRLRNHTARRHTAKVLAIAVC